MPGSSVPARVVHLDLGEQGAGVLVDGAGVAGDVAVEGLVGELLEVNDRVLAGVDQAGVALGHGDEDAQPIDLRDGEERAALAAGAGAWSGERGAACRWSRSCCWPRSAAEPEALALLDVGAGALPPAEPCGRR